MSLAGKQRTIGGFIAALIALGMFVAPASADLTNMIFSIEAVSGSAHGTWAACLGDGHWNEDMNGFQWSLPGSVEVRDPQSGAVVATISGAEVSYVSDPQVNLSFAVFAGSDTTTFIVRSALLSFPTIAHPAGLATASFSVTDGDDEGGALLSGLGGMAYTADTNGFVPGGTHFTQMIPGIAAPLSGTNSLTQDFPGGGAFFPIGMPVSDMSSQIAFTLSANDLASGTSVFQIQPVPEPWSCALLAACVALLRRR